MKTELSQSDYQRYAAELPSFKPSSCSCKTCAGLCKMVPCFGTPQEVKAIIDAGKKNILARRWHLGTVAHGMPPLDCVMIRAVAIGNGCSQLTADNKCKLHETGLKPSEGKFANHAETTSSFWGIASTWFLDENAELVEWIRNQFPPLEPLDEVVAKGAEEFATQVNAYIAAMDDPNDLVEREKICAEASRAFRKEISEYIAAKDFSRMLREALSAKLGRGIQIEILRIEEEKACAPVSV